MIDEKFGGIEVITSNFYVAQRFHSRLMEALDNHCVMFALTNSRVSPVKAGNTMEGIAQATERTGVVLVFHFDMPDHPDFTATEHVFFEKTKMHYRVTHLVSVDVDAMHMLPTAALLAEYLTKQLDIVRENFLLRIAQRSMEHLKLCEEVSIKKDIPDLTRREAFHRFSRHYNIKLLDCTLNGIESAKLYFKTGAFALGEMTKIMQAVEP